MDNAFVILALSLWVLSTFFESWHDWRLHLIQGYRESSPETKDRIKSLDAMEKAVFLLAFSTLWYGETGDIVSTGIFSVWQVWLRWVGHEAWYSFFSGAKFGLMGTSSVVDLAINYIGLGRWGNVAVMLLPVIALTLMLAR